MTTQHPLRLFNSLGREVQEFQPIDPRNVRVYSCGPTVYNYAHIGNLRAYVFADTLRRVLTFKGYNVTHIINITDVGHLTSDADTGEDKMEVAASREKKSIWDIAAHYTDVFKDDVRRLNILEPSHWTPATQHIQEMIAFARELDAAGYLYELEDGAYFDISKVADYGRLGLLDLAGMGEEHRRVEGPGGKRHPADFAVWRKSPGGVQRQMEWHSPWGVGAPGWHLECSVMSMKYLGEQFDIHTGGIDHRQVHHCNEIAQNQGYTRSENSGANWWMHNEFLIMRDGKMSKSSGKFLTLQSIVDQGIHPVVYRLFLLGASYRSSLEFTWDALVGTRASLRRLLLRIADLKAKAEADTVARLAGEMRYSSGGSLAYLRQQLAAGLSPRAAEWADTLDAAVSNDLATPAAVAHLNELLFDKKLAPEETLRLAALADLVLGLNLLTLTVDDLIIRPAGQTLDEATITARLAERTEARKAKDFARSDAIRDELLAKGVGIMDTPQGTTFEWLPLAGAE